MLARFLGYKNCKGEDYTAEEISQMDLPNWMFGEIIDVMPRDNLRLPWISEEFVCALRACEIELLPEKPFNREDYL